MQIPISTQKSIKRSNIKSIQYVHVGMITKNKHENQHMYNDQPLLAFQTEILIAKFMQTNRKKSKQELNEIQKNLAKPWQKAKQLTFTPGLKQVVRFLDVER
jgi:hypothetical protein